MQTDRDADAVVTHARLTDELADLVARGTLTQEQARAVLAAVDAAAATAGVGSAGTAPVAGAVPTTAAATRQPAARVAWTTVLAEVGGYVGGSFVLASAVVLTGSNWGELDTGQRLAVLGIPALLLLLAAAGIAASTPGGWPVHERRGLGARRRLVAALVLVAGALAGGVTGVLTDSPEQEALFGVTACAVWAAGYLACRTPQLHVATAAAATWSIAMTPGWFVDGDGIQRTGWSIIALAAIWTVLSLRGLLDEPTLGLATAGTMGFIGAEILTSTDGGARALGYVVLALLALAGLGGYVATRHIAVLGVGVVALATVVPQAVIDYTDGSLGAAGALLVTGLSIVGASTLGLRLHRSPQ